MPVVLYRDENYQGPSLRLQPGFYTGRRDFEEPDGEDLSDQASSVRVDAGYVVALYGGLSETARGGGARTLVGPAAIPELAAVGMNDKVSAAQVFLYEPHRAAVPRDFGVTLYSMPGQTGTRAEVGQGDYSSARLASEEVKLPRFRSLCVKADTLVVLYEGADFDSTLDSVVVAGPRCLDLETVGLIGDDGSSRVGSLRVLYAAALLQRQAAPPAAEQASPPLPRGAPPSGGAKGFPPRARPAPQLLVPPAPQLPARGRKKRGWLPFLLLIFLIVLSRICFVRSNSRIWRSAPRIP